MSASPRPSYCVTPSVSSDDGSSSSSGGSAPPSPRRSVVRPPPPRYHVALKGAALSLPLASKKTATTDDYAADERSAGSSSPASVPSSLAVASPRPVVSLETLLDEKRIMLASFEAKFNEKIMSRHMELLNEQKREAEHLKGELEEQKFSHGVETTLLKKKVKELEGELEEANKRASNDAAGGNNLEDDRSAYSSAESDRMRIGVLEEELRRERRLRIDQLRSLEQLHFAEFRQIEKKHAESVSHLVATYQKEIKDTKSKMNTACNITKSDKSGEKVPPENSAKVSPEQQASSEDTAAAAALSSMATTQMAGCSGSPSKIACDVDSLAVAVANVGDNNQTPSPIAVAKKGESKPAGKTEAGAKKRNLSVVSRISSVLQLDVSDISDSGSTSGDSSSTGDNSEDPEQPAKKARTSRQRQQVEEILRKVGKKPPSDPYAKPKNPKEKKVLSKKTKDYLKAWMMSPEHCAHPYPTPEEKAAIMADTGISFTELNNWFVNNRKRFWLNCVKPRIPEIREAHRTKTVEEGREPCCAET